MPSVYDLKPRFQRLLRPVMKRMVRLGVRPNHVTIVAAVGSIIAGAMVPYRGWLWLLPAFLLARMGLNAIDGMMAREFNLASDLGAILNELGDIVSDIALYMPLAFLHTNIRWPAIAFTIGAVLTEFCGVLARSLGASRRYDGPMGKSDRALLIGVLGLVGWLVPMTLHYWPWVIGLAAVASIWTCLNRLRAALAEIGQG